MDENKKDEIIADLKQEGLDLAEDVTKESIEHVFEFAIKAINKYGNAVLKAAIPLLQTAENFLLELADKINGVQDNA